MTGDGGWFGPHDYLILGAEQDRLAAESSLDAVLEDPAAEPEQIAAAEADLAEAITAYEDASAAYDRQREAEAEAAEPEPEAGT